MLVSSEPLPSCDIFCFPRGNTTIRKYGDDVWQSAQALTTSGRADCTEQFPNQSFLVNAYEVMTNKNKPPQSPVNTTDEAPSANNSRAMTAPTGTTSSLSSKT